MNEISKIIKEFEKLPYKGYVWKSPKHEHTDSYFYLAIQISKCMMRSDTFNSHVEPVITQMTNTQNMNIYDMNTQKIPDLNVCYSDKSKSKGIIGDKILLQVCSTYKSKPERFNVNEISTEKSK